MAFSAGTFSLYSPGNPVVTGTTIASTWANNTLNDIATGLSTCLLKDGSQTVTGNIPMSSFRITGLGAATAVTDAARTSQVQNSSFTYLTSVAGTNTITATATPTPAAYAIGQCFDFIPANTNTGATTLNISGLGAGAIQNGGVALGGYELKASVPVRVVVSAATPVFQIVATQASSGLVLLGTSSASASATISFTTNINSVFDEYLITISDMVAATDNQNMSLQASEDSGANYKSGGTDYAHSRHISLDGVAVEAGSTGDNSIVLAGSVSNSKSLGGEIRIFSPAGTSRHKMFTYDISYEPSGSTIGRIAGSGVFKLDTNAINAVRFLMAAGNITAGNFALYGVRKT